MAGITALYRATAALPDGLARRPEEVSEDGVASFIARSSNGGVLLVCERNGEIVGELHAATIGIACFAHVLTDLTVAVAPHVQGQGIGRQLFVALLDIVSTSMPHITRIELFTRESNARARHLYASLGFVEEGRLRARVNNAQGVPEADIVMGWLRPQPS